MINYVDLVKPEYCDMCANILSVLVRPSLQIISDLYVLKILSNGALDIVNKQLQEEIGATITIEYTDLFDPAASVSIIKNDDLSVLLITADELPARALIMQQLIIYEVNSVQIVLPCFARDYVPHHRFVIDKILVDGQLMKCTDVHITPVTDDKRNVEYIIQYRKGLFLDEIVFPIKITVSLFNTIVNDLIANRSSTAFRAVNALLDTATPFAIVDPMYPSRCELVKTIWGSACVIRFFNFKNPFEIETLGFNQNTQDALHKLTDITSGLTLISGVIGSGKGTTVNAVALEIQKSSKHSIMSIDSPTEYLGRFAQIEYLSQQQLYEACNAVKKMDINCVLLNEIAAQETARAVYNLVVSGVHVLTTIHCNRVYRMPYKLQEMLGELYVNLIPFLNFISYQDKFSITCKDCYLHQHADEYSDIPDAMKLLKYLELDFIVQPVGCRKCNFTGIVSKGIQVVSEHLFLSSEDKDNLLKLNIHDQSKYLQKRVNDMDSLERTVMEKLLNGDILLNEAVVKLQI